MTQDREVEEVRDGSLEHVFSAPYPVYEVTYGTSHDQTERNVLQSASEIKSHKQVPEEQQCDE